MRALKANRRLEAVGSQFFDEKPDREVEHLSLHPVPSHGFSNSEEIWVGIHFPQLSLDIFESKDGLPVAVIEEIRGRQIICSACDQAMAQGVMPGMPLNAAYVLCRDLSIQVRDEKAELELLESRAERIGRYSPAVSLEPPDTMLVEISRSLKLFGGFDSLDGLIRQSLPPGAIVSVATVPGAASLLARSGREQIIHSKSDLRSVLGNIRIHETGLEKSLVHQLNRCGLESLRDLWRLPRADLARRFGAELVKLLDHLSGSRAEIRVRRMRKTRFYQFRDLPVESDDAKLVMLAAEALLEKAREFLQSRSAATEVMVFRLWYAKSGQPKNEQPDFAVLRIRSQQSGRVPSRFMPQFREKLERMELYGPIRRVSLRIDQVVQYRQESADLFDYQPDRLQGQPDWPQLVDILSARLGDRMVYQVIPDPDHRPEKAWRFISPGDVRIRRSEKTDDSAPGLNRPCWLLDKPRKVSLRAPATDLDCGTERVESGWWDNQDVRRDYRTAYTKRGSRYWVYQNTDEVKNEVKEGGGEYYLHGLYG